MKTAHKWLIIGLIELMVGGGLVFGAGPIIKSGKTGWGYAMIAAASIGLLGSGGFAATRAYSSLKAKRVLIESFPDRASWREIPVYDFLDVTPERVSKALPLLEEALLDSNKTKDLNGSSVLSFIIESTEIIPY